MMNDLPVVSTRESTRNLPRSRVRKFNAAHEELRARCVYRYMQRALGGRGAIDLGLQRVLSVLRELGRPQQALEGRVVHVGGTNGKGSVCAYIAAALRDEGHRVGVFTSPHLVRPCGPAQPVAAPVAARVHPTRSECGVRPPLVPPDCARCASRRRLPSTGGLSARMSLPRPLPRCSARSRGCSRSHRQRG